MKWSSQRPCVFDRGITWVSDFGRKWAIYLLYYCTYKLFEENSIDKDTNKNEKNLTYYLCTCNF